MIPTLPPSPERLLATLAAAAEIGEFDPTLLRAGHACALRAKGRPVGEFAVELIAEGRPFAGAHVVECEPDPARVAALATRHRGMRIRVLLEPLSQPARERTVRALARAGANELCLQGSVDAAAIEALGATAIGLVVLGERALRVAAPAPDDPYLAYELCIAGSRWGAALPSFRLTGAETALRAALAERD